ncbi:SLC13 family permease [Thioclava electrotropha]|uniref:SLC13 family permease n=1 Tax=Thioclava electrotropha TaxID=1549850 RepID=A0ABX6YQK4_9RHOB|nr:SLC13 family permease [Thioclava electrotropha]QPZ90101.1 SLC13 family permease [Thioclava electrotropha]
MTAPQITLFAILGGTLSLFLWGRFRHDLVALASLMACVLTGLVPADAAFAGFGHPAVITVACVLILSQGLQNTGAVDWLARAVLPSEANRLTSMTALVALSAVLSGFMNNVGALALLMPIAIRLAGRLDLTPGQMLMPLAFGTILGGMTTLVGTPPNLIVSGFRAEAGLGQFGMFDYAPVGVAVAFVGVAFIALLGWRIVPARKPMSKAGFDTGSYLTEVRVPDKSKAVGLTLRKFERGIEKSGAQIIGLVRNDVRMTAPHGGRRIQADDVLILEAEAQELAEVLSAFGITLEEEESGSARAERKAGETTPKTENDEAESNKSAEDTDAATKPSDRDEDIVLREFAVLPGSTIVGQSATDLRLRTRYGLNLLAVSREGRPPRTRLRTLKLKPGDLLMLQGPAEIMADFMNETGCAPLGERELHLPNARMAIIASALLLGSIGIATFGLLPASVAFTLGVLGSMLLRTVPPGQVYKAIDWPVIVLLGSLIPVAGAMQTTGAADVLARFLVETIARGNAIAALAAILVTTMFLSDLMNNAATAAVLSPVALGIAASLDVNPDSFLMAVAIGASCAFLTPIGHQNNTLILGSGGFRFGDYWKLGLPLEVIVVAVSLPLLLIVWPL